MKNTAKRIIANEKGAAAVEFAMVLGIFLLVFLGIIEYGWVMTRQIVLSHAVREGARAAVAMPAGTSDEELEDKARETAKASFSMVGTLLDADIDVEIRENENYMEHPLPRRIFVIVASWAYAPLTGYLPDSAVPDALASTANFMFP